jgi:hypothetical protein
MSRLPNTWQLICFPLTEPRVQDATNEKQIAPTAEGAFVARIFHE